MNALGMPKIRSDHPVSIFADYFSGLDRKVCPLAPLWSDFDPMEVPRLLQWMVVIERKDITLEGHVIRVMGEGVKQLFAINLTKMTLAVVFDKETIASRWKTLIDVAETREPAFNISRIPVKSRSFIQVYRGCFPFCDENRNINRLIVVVAPVNHH